MTEHPTMLTIATDRATSAASSGSTRPATTSRASRTSRCTRSSTAARSRPASPPPTVGGYIMTQRDARARQPGLRRARAARARRRARDRPRALLDDRLQRVGELAAGPPLAGSAATAASSRWRTTATSSTPSSCTPSCASAASRFRSTSDSEIIAALLATHAGRAHRGRDRRRPAAPAGRVLDRRDDARTASSRFRDPAGLRPLVLGQLGERYCVASESCALDIIGAKLPARRAAGRDRLDRRATGIRTRQVVEGAREAFCVFEYIYFARPDSRMDGDAAAGRARADGRDPRPRGAGRAPTS